MDIQSVKIDLIHWLTLLEDTYVLEKIQSLKEQQESSFELGEENQIELELRLQKYENGEMQFSSWDEVKSRVRTQSKDGL
ncbi:MAG: addiction module protein [Mongoliitalea sp.]